MARTGKDQPREGEHAAVLPPRARPGSCSWLAPADGRHEDAEDRRGRPRSPTGRCSTCRAARAPSTRRATRTATSAFPSPTRRADGRRRAVHVEPADRPPGAADHAAARSRSRARRRWSRWRGSRTIDAGVLLPRPRRSVDRRRGAGGGAGARGARAVVTPAVLRPGDPLDTRCCRRPQRGPDRSRPRPTGRRRCRASDHRRGAARRRARRDLERPAKSPSEHPAQLPAPRLAPSLKRAVHVWTGERSSCGSSTERR